MPRPRFGGLKRRSSEVGARSQARLTMGSLSELVGCCWGALDASFASPTHPLRRDDLRFAELRFAKAEDADAFCE
jgi:hypothetical protein